MNPHPLDRFDDVVDRRRSIRRYRVETPPPDWLEAMIACAAKAPSPSNRQPVRFVRLCSRETLDLLRETMIRTRRDLLTGIRPGSGANKVRNLINFYYRYSEFIVNAPVLIAVATLVNGGGFSESLQDAGALTHGAGESELDITVGLAVSALLLKAAALGLGACIETAPLRFLPDVEKKIGVEGLRIRCFVTAGFPAEAPATPEKHGVSTIYSEV